MNLLCFERLAVSNAQGEQPFTVVIKYTALLYFFSSEFSMMYRHSQLLIFALLQRHVFMHRSVIGPTWQLLAISTYRLHC